MNEDLFELAQFHFKQFLAEFKEYGIEADPGIELRRGDGLLCYYDLNDGHIYMALPDLTAPIGKLQLLFLRSLLNCETNDEVLYFFRLLLPRVIAHELAHHYRQRYGLFGENLWHEEQIANQLATAVTKQRYSPLERDQAQSFLIRAIIGLEMKLGVQNMAADSYYSIWQALNVSGQINDVAMNYMELAHQLFAIPPSQILESSGQLSESISQRIENREIAIQEINKEYADNFMRYFYYQMSWLYLDLTTHENHYVEDFARHHLNIQAPLLPRIEEGVVASEEAIIACFKAHKTTATYSRACSHFFYKRYRSLLITSLQTAEATLLGQADRLRKESAFLLQNWNGREREPDMLEYLAHLAPPPLRKLFPHQITEYDKKQFPVQMHLPTETDKRLWRLVVLNNDDQGAVNTLNRLRILDNIEIYQALPAEVLLELAHNFCRVRLRPLERIIWQGEISHDVYIVISGQLEVIITQQHKETLLGHIKAGDVFGEMAFFTREPRNATIRATEPTDCFVLKHSDLYLFSYKYPSIIMEMARILTKRLHERNKLV